MIGFLLSLPARLKVGGLLIAGALFAIAGAYLKGRASGKASAHAERMKEKARAIKKAREVERDVSALSDDDVDHRLSEWVSDDER